MSLLAASRSHKSHTPVMKRSLHTPLPRGGIDRLPMEMKLLILSHLPVEDLGRMSVVSREWHELGSDDLMWKERFLVDSMGWDSYVGGEPSLGLWERICRALDHALNEHNTSDPSPSSWRQRYITQWSNILHSRKLLEKDPKHHTRDPLVALSGIHLPFKLPFVQTPIRTMCFGMGLERSARKLMKQLMFRENSPLEMTGLHQGVNGIGAGVGFRLAASHLNVMSLYGIAYNEAVFCTHIRPHWQKFFQSVGGFIYVVDRLARPGGPSGESVFGTEKIKEDPSVAVAAGSEKDKEDDDNPEETKNARQITQEMQDFGEICHHARTELQLVLGEACTTHEVPLLVWMCFRSPQTTDSEPGCTGAGDEDGLSAAEMAWVLGLPQGIAGKRPWRVQRVNMDDLSGIREGLTWLLENV